MRLAAGNSILIAGSIARRPDQKAFGNGTPYIKFRIRYGRLDGSNRYRQIDVMAAGALFPYAQKLKTGMRIMAAGKLSTHEYIPTGGRYAGERRIYEEMTAEYISIMPPVTQFAQEENHHHEVTEWERNLHPDVTF